MPAAIIYLQSAFDRDVRELQLLTDVFSADQKIYAQGYTNISDDGWIIFKRTRFTSPITFVLYAKAHLQCFIHNTE